MKSKKRNVVCIVIFVIVIMVVMCVVIFNKYVFVKDIRYQEPIGIIDTYLNKTYEQMEYYSEYKSEDVEETHGDALVEFVRAINYEGKIFYYAAVTEEGEIETDKIIDGLEWMIEAGIERVNISLSSKIYSKKFETWIKEHPEIRVYCSYNNLYNSVTDFPALYEGVIASGCDKRINYREQDQAYKSNRIIVYDEKIKKYNGNSYLSLYSLLLQE